MKKRFLFFALLLTGTLVYAHTLVMNTLDNEDNTITVFGEFSTGEQAAGAMVRLESLVSGKVLFKERLPVESELTVGIPKEPYQIVLDGGPGHIIVKEGIAPLEGFTESLQTKANNNAGETLSKAEQNTGEWSLPTLVLFSSAFFLFLLTLYFSAMNTERILKETR